MQNFYFTFGSDPRFPYYRGYLIVKAETQQEAIQKFRAKYPDRSKHCINCAFYYSEKEWESIEVDMGICHEVIE